MEIIKRTYRLLLLFILGVACVFYGLGISYINYSFSASYLILVAVGVLCLLEWSLIVIKEVKKHSSIKQKKRALIISSMILLFVIIVVEINYLAIKYDKRFDLTKTKQHTLSEFTLKQIENLTRELKFTAFYVGVPPKYLEDLFREYSRVSKGKIETEIIDPLVNLSYAANFGNFISGSEQKVFIRAKGAQGDTKEIDFTNEPLTEERLTNGIVRATRKAANVYFLVGHGEYDIFNEKETGLSTFGKILLSNNILSRNLILGVTKAIPTDCDTLVITGPKKELSIEEEKIINEYLDKGGDALILIENTLITTPDRPLTEEEKTRNPSLNNILKNWGLKVAFDTVVDLSSHMSGDVGTPATKNYMSHKEIVRDVDYTFYLRPRSISMIDKPRRSIQFAPFVLTASEESWGETNRYLEVKLDEVLDRPGPVPIAFVVYEPRIKGKISDTRIMVFTDADFLTNNYIGELSNANMGLNAIKWLSELDYQVFLDRKEIKVEMLNLTSKQKRVIAVILLAIPIAIAVCGILVWQNERIER